MAFEIIGEFLVKGTDKAKKQFDGVAGAVGNLNEELDKNREATQLLDQATGGISTQVLDFKDKIVGGFTAVKNLTKGMKLLKVAMISSGIGALVVLLAGIAANWETITNYMSGASLEAQKQVALTNEIAEAEQEKLDSLNGQDNILKLQGKTEKEILQLKAAQTKETITALEASILAQEEVKKQQIESAERGQKILSGILQFISLPMTAILKAYDYITGSNSMKIFDDAASLLFDPEGTAEEADESIDKTQKQLDRLKNSYAGYQLSIDKIDQDAADKKKADDEKKEADADADRQRQADKELAELQKLLDAKEALEQDYFDKQLTAKQLEEQAVADKYFNLIEQAKKFNLDTAILEEAQKKELAAIDADYKAKDVATAQSVQDQKVKVMSDFMGSASKILGESSKAGKSAAIAQATINTYQGVTEVWRAPSTLPEPFGTIQKIASTATVLASGLQTVRKIKQVPKPEGVKDSGGGGGGTPSGAPSQPPRFNIVGSSSTDQLGDAIAESTKKPSRSYVVSSDVSTAQELERKTVTDASI